MKKIILFILFIVPVSVFSQGFYSSNDTLKTEKKLTFKPENLAFGGGLGLQFGTLTRIEVSPQVGYWFTQRVIAGLNMTYQYYRLKDPAYTIETSIYGGGTFGRFFFTQNIFAHAEIESLNIEFADSYPPYDLSRKWITSYFVGGGFMQRFSKKGGVYMMLLWNLNQTIESPYSNPVIRGGILF